MSSEDEIKIDWDTDLTELDAESIKKFVHKHNPRTIIVEEMGIAERALYDLVNTLIVFDGMVQTGTYDLTPPVTPARIRDHEVRKK